MPNAPDHITITCPDCGNPIELHGGVSEPTASGNVAVTYDPAPMTQHIHDAHPASEETS